VSLVKNDIVGIEEGLTMGPFRFEILEIDRSKVLKNLKDLVMGHCPMQSNKILFLKVINHKTGSNKREVSLRKSNSTDSSWRAT